MRGLRGRGGGGGMGDLPLPRYNQDLNTPPSRMSCKQSTALVVVGVVAAIFITVQALAFFEFSSSSANVDLHTHFQQQQHHEQQGHHTDQNQQMHEPHQQAHGDTDGFKDKTDHGQQGVPPKIVKEEEHKPQHHPQQLPQQDQAEMPVVQHHQQQQEQHHEGHEEGHINQPDHANQQQQQQGQQQQQHHEGHEEGHEEGHINQPDHASQQQQQQQQQQPGLRCMADGKMISVPLDAIDDDFCDCTNDGQDEPNTAACAGVRKEGFTCPVEQSTIPSSRVADGVCDCCDGADERTRHDVACPDKCDAFREKQREREQAIKQGRALRASYLAEGQAARFQALEANSNNNNGGVVESAVAWGPDDAFYPLTKGCYEHEQGQYRYKLCPFKSAEQIDLKGGGGGGSRVKLGSRAQFGRLAKERIVEMTGGQTCSGVGPRTAEVHFTCGVDDRITRVSEPQKCVYVFDFESPAACA